MKYLDTFAGIGGFSIGIHAVDPLAECIGYSEIDKYASSVYEKHYPGVHNYGDITKINADELPDFDLLVGGFPCQAFSIAGKRRGFEDTRGTLFFDLARILKAKTPRLFVFENVKGLLSHDGGATFKTIIAATSELGYDCQWQVLNSKNHGVPQNRERIIIVGHLRGTPRPEVFPLGYNDSQATDLQGQYTNTLTTRYYGGQANGSYVIESELDAQERSGVVVAVKEATKKGYAEATVGDTINITQPNSKTRRGRVQHDAAGTLQTNESMVTVTPDYRIRRLTPIECERLQAFPDDWTKYGVRQQPEGYECLKCSGVNNESHGAYCKYNLVEISDTQRYKMCGNAVTTNVIRDVMERIIMTEKSYDNGIKHHTVQLAEETLHVGIAIETPPHILDIAARQAAEALDRKAFDPSALSKDAHQVVFDLLEDK